MIGQALRRGVSSAARHRAGGGPPPATPKEDYSGIDDTSKGAIFGTGWRGQVFTASSSYSATSFKVLLSTNGAPGTLTGGLYAVGASKPTGAALATATFDGNTLTSTSVWVEFVLSTGVALTSGTQYALVFAAPSGNSSNALTLRAKAPGDYAGGSYVFSSNSGTSWSTDTGDIMFQVYGT